MHVSTRPTTAAERDYARDVHHRAYRDVVVRQFGVWDEDAQDGFFDRAWGDGSEHEILLSDGRPCGYVAVERLPAYLHVRELVVDPVFQSRGIGTAFLRQQQARAAARQVPVQLGTFHKNRALSLYRRLGFREFDRTETHVLLVWEDDRR